MKAKINEIFFSIQGEGVLIGTPTIFIRLYGCNLRCSWCDSMYSVEGDDFKELSISNIIKETQKYRCDNICITGGEPLLQFDFVTLLTEKLLKVEKKIILETAGHISPPKIYQNINTIVSMDCKCPSSKMEGKSNKKNLLNLSKKDQIKFVIKDETDYLYAKKLTENNNFNANIIFQPVWGSNPVIIADKVLKDNLDVRVLPQIHKNFWGDIKGK